MASTGTSDSERNPSPDNPGFALTSLQHKLITTALAGLSFFVICALLFVVFRVLTAFVSEFTGVLLPLAIASILAMILRPLVAFLEEKTRLERQGATITLYALVVLILAATLWFVIPILIEQLIHFIRSIPAIYEGLQQIVSSRFPALLNYLTEIVGEEEMANLGGQLRDQISSNARDLIALTASAGQQYLMTLFAFTTGAAIIPVYLFFFLKSTPVTEAQVAQQLSWVRDDVREDILFLGRQFAGSILTFFQGQILVGLIMGALLAVGFSIAGINFGFAIGLLIGLLNIIPYLGTIIGLAVVIPIAWFQPEGGPVLVAIALAIFTAVQMLEGYLLTPRIMGNRTGLHPLTIIIAIFFWGTALNGILGMILAIPLTAFFVVVWRLLRDKYLKEWTR